ncbi:NUDIX hydrolase [Litchfieldia alkalitelluris]|uniref:NUDIX hydrolase n=1 Tax=Litchfieldia alkalitelluris TaxID=304268 RepID=UPI0009986219|nr:NUDIX domain-containing protein [Litchfieldia alkalitelluris]
MIKEHLAIFTDTGERIGEASREDVHKVGYLHETFHCWFITRANNRNYIYLQIRSEDKKDFPNLLDITAAGHLLSTETVVDGVREVEEELGISVAFEELVSLGTIRNSLQIGSFIDNELCHVYLYPKYINLNEFNIQKEELSGIVKAEFNEISDLWMGKIQNIIVAGFKYNKLGEKEFIEMKVGMNDFVQHERQYFDTIIKKMKQQLNI